MLTRRSLLGLAGALAGASTLAAWFAPALSLAGCGSDQDDKSADRAPVLDQVTDQVIAPGITALHDRAEALPAALEALATGPTAATLAAARTAWGDARGAYRRSMAYAVGSSPSDDINVTGGILDEPSDGAKIEALAASTTPVDLTTQPASVRGFLAIEYLLFDPAHDDATVATTFAGDAGAGRVNLLRALSSDLHGKLAAVADGWQKSGGFLAEVRSAGQGSSYYPSQKSAFDAILNQTLKVSDRLIDIVRKSAGVAGSDATAPTADRSDRTLADLLDDLSSIESVYGSGALTISSIVIEVNPDTDQAMHAALTSVRSALTSFTPPLRGAGTDRAAAVDDLITRMRSLKAALSAQVFSALGTTATITDKDGD